MIRQKYRKIKCKATDEIIWRRRLKIARKGYDSYYNKRTRIYLTIVLFMLII